MLTIILTLVVSLLVAFLATSNATLVTLHLGTTTLADIPLFFVVLTSIIIGTLVAGVVNIINLVKSKLTIYGQKGALKKSYKLPRPYGRGFLRAKFNEAHENSNII